MKLTHMVPLPAVALALAACGGDSTPPANPQHFSGPDDSIATRISSATSLEDAATFQTSAKVLRRDFAADTTTQLPDVPMSVRLFRTSPTAAPTLVIKTEAGEYSFGPEDLDDWDNFFKENSGSWTVSRSWLSHANGYRLDEDGDFVSAAGRIDPQSFKYHVPFAFWTWNEDEEIATRQFAAIGIATAPSDMPQSRTAYYNGYGRIEFYRVDDPGERMRFGLDEVYLTADFADGTISGLLDEWELWEDDDAVPTEISYEFLPTPIDSNGFSTSLAPSASCATIAGLTCPTMPDSNVTGKFYGSYASEVGGTIETGEFEFEGENWIGIGAFNTAEE